MHWPQKLQFFIDLIQSSLHLEHANTHPVTTKAYVAMTTNSLAFNTLRQRERERERERGIERLQRERGRAERMPVVLLTSCRTKRRNCNCGSQCGHVCRLSRMTQTIKDTHTFWHRMHMYKFGHILHIAHNLPTYSTCTHIHVFGYPFGHQCVNHGSTTFWSSRLLNYLTPLPH